MKDKIQKLIYKIYNGPWKVRTHSALPCFVEAPRNKKMGYALDVCGEDYTGYGDDKQREKNMTAIAHVPDMIIMLLNIYINHGSEFATERQLEQAEIKALIENATGKKIEELIRLI